MHGGMGMTDQFDIGFFMKRARVCQELFGDSNFHADQLARREELLRSVIPARAKTRIARLTGDLSIHAVVMTDRAGVPVPLRGRSGGRSRV